MIVIANSLEKKFLLFMETSIVLYLNILIVLTIRGTETVLFTLILSLIIISASITIPLEKDAGIWFSATFLGLSIAIAWLGTMATALCLVFASITGRITGEFLSLLVAGLSTTVLTMQATTELNNIRFFINLIAAFAVILTSAIIARQAIRGSPKFAWIREKAVFWAATGGTSFYGVDLTDACFDGADLPHTDFRKANLTRASFEEATGLELARLQGTIL